MAFAASAAISFPDISVARDFRRLERSTVVSHCFQSIMEG